VQGPTKVKGWVVKRLTTPARNAWAAGDNFGLAVGSSSGSRNPKHPLMFDRRVATTASDVPAAVVIATRPDRGATE
jgi:hypothetical protein